MYIFSKKSFDNNKEFFDEIFKLVEEELKKESLQTTSISNTNPPSFEIFTENGEMSQSLL